MQQLRTGRLVADHDRLWAKHQTVSDPEHVAAATALRGDRIGLIRKAAGRVDEQDPGPSVHRSIRLDAITDLLPGCCSLTSFDSR